MEHAALWAWIFVVYLFVSVPVWGLPALVGIVLLQWARTMQDKPWQQAYAAGAAGGMLFGALVGMGSFFYADAVLKIAGLEWKPGERPGWLSLATPRGALVTAVASTLALLLAIAVVHGVTRLSARRADRTPRKPTTES